MARHDMRKKMKEHFRQKEVEEKENFEFNINDPRTNLSRLLEFVKRLDDFHKSKGKPNSSRDLDNERHDEDELRTFAEVIRNHFVSRLSETGFHLDLGAGSWKEIEKAIKLLDLRTWSQFRQLDVINQKKAVRVQLSEFFCLPPEAWANTEYTLAQLKQFEREPSITRDRSPNLIYSSADHTGIVRRSW